MSLDGRYQRTEPLNIDMDALQQTTVGIIGLGATGSHMAENLARLGANLVLIDRDFLEPQNLSTSALYTEQHVSDALPKAVAAKNALEAINSDATVTEHVADVNSQTVDRLLADVDIILDGTDNLVTRFLLNEYAVNTGTPWIHVSALGFQGEVLPVIPEETACFHCLFADKDGSQLETCETAGILKETAAAVAGVATTATIRILSGETPTGLTRLDMRDGAAQTYDVSRRDDCSVCQQQDFHQLDEEPSFRTTTLCGENKYQVTPSEEQVLDLSALKTRLQEQGTVTQNPHLLRFTSDDAQFTVFKNGRAILSAETPEQAKSLYSRFIGN